MSTEVEQRVVEMRFDNKHFESNVATTMSTLDKLKRALHLDGASKGLENVNSAANKVNMSGLASGAETVRAKFSALEVVAVTALANITNSAVNAGKRIVSALTIDPVKTGFQEYEMKMDSIKTIVNSTGRDLKDVNKLLEELNEYSDQTIYSFKDMTQNIGKFTNAGVGLEEAVLAIKGISNEAAVSGASAAEASRAMYNFSQALSAGYVKLIDWKSIENANMATKEFKQQLIDTAVELGVVTQAGDMYTTSTGKSFNATKNFNDTLQEQWMTTDVLITTLGKYADSTTDIGKKAFAAAQEVTKMTQMWDVLKETAQSGWAKTWELIVGDLEAAKKIWTPLTNFFSDIINAMSDARNRVLEIALNFSKYWDSITSKMGNVKKVVTAIDTITDKLNYFQDVVSKVWRGDYKNSDTGRFELLENAGYDHRVVQDLVNKGYQYKLTIEDVEASHKKFGLTLTTTTEETEELTTKLEVLDAETLKNLGLTEEEIELYNALAKEAKRTGKTINQIADTMAKNNGREVLIDSFKNFGTVIVDIANTIKSALAEIFEIPTVSDVAIRLHGMIMSLHEFSENIQIINKETGELNETGKKFKSIFKGVFAIVDIILTTIKGPTKIAFTVLKEILSFFGVNVLDILAKVGEKFVSFRDTVDKVIGTITKFIVDNVGKWLEKFKETEFFKTTADWFADSSERISGALGNISNKINNFNASSLGKTLKTIADFISKTAKTVSNSKVVTFAVDAIRGAFAGLKKFFAGFKLPKFNLENLRMFFTNFTKLGENITASGKGGIAGVVDGIGKTLGGHTSLTKAKTKFQNGVETFFSGFVSFWLKIGDSLKKAFKVCQDALKGIVKFIFGTEEVNLPTIMDAVEKFLWILTLLKTIKLLDTFVSPFENITDALKSFANAKKWEAIGSAFKAMALALGVLTLCIVVLSQLDSKKALTSAGILAGLLVVMGGIIGGLGFLASKIGGLDVKGMLGISLSLLILIGAIALMVKTLKDFDNLKLNDPLKTFAYLAATITALTFGVKLVSKAIGKSNFAAIAGLLTLILALKQMLEVINLYDQENWVGKADAIMKIVQMLVILAAAVNLATRGVKAGSNVKGLAFIILAMVISLKIMLDAMKEIATMDDTTLIRGSLVIANLLGMMTGMMAVANLTSKGTKLKKGEKNVNNFTGLAVALLAVCAAIWLLGKMDTETLTQGGLAVTHILGLMTIMLSLLGKYCKGLKIGPITTMIIAFGLLIAEIALLVRWLDDVSWQSKVSSFVALGGVLLAMASVLKILTKSRIKAKNIYKWLGALAALGLVVAELALILYAIKDINPLSAVGNATALAGLLLAMSGVLHVLSGLDMRKLSDQKMTKLALVFAGMGLILAELAFVLYSIKDMDPQKALANATALTLLLSAVAGVLYVVSSIKNTNNVTKVVLAMAALGLIVGELAFILYSIQDLNPTSALGNTTALSELLIVLTGVMAACAGLSKVIGNNIKGFYVAASGIAALGLVVGELALILKDIEDLDSQASLSNARVLEELIIVLTGVMGACALLSSVVAKNAKGFWIAAGGLASLGPVVYELGLILDKINDLDLSGMEKEVKMLAQLLIALTGVLFACTLLGLIIMSVGWVNIAGTGIAIGSLAVLGLIIWELGGIVKSIKNMDLSGAEPGVAIVTKLLYDLVEVLKVCALFGLLSPFALASTIVLAALGLVLWELGGIVKSIKNMDLGGAEPGVAIVTNLLYNLVPVLAACSLLGIGSLTAVGAVGALAALGLVVLELGYFLSLMKDWDVGSMMPTVLVLSLLLNNLVPVLEACTIVGFAAPAALAGIGTLVTLIGALEGVIIALGAIMSIPGLKKLLDTGIAMLEKLAYGIGSIISKFTEGLTTGLPGIAQNLSDFATNLGTFLDVINNDLTNETVTKASQLAEVVTALVGADFKQAIRSIFGKDDSIADLGTKLSDFGQNIGDFIKAINSFKPESAASMDSFASAIKTLNDVCGNNNFGDGALKELGTQTKDFAASMKSVAISLNEFTDEDVKNIERARDGAKAIAELNEYVPKTGGLWQDIAGVSDLQQWGWSIEAFADSLILYSDKVTGKSIDTEAIQASASAAQSMVEVTSGLQKTGGMLQSITGVSDLAGFGETIVAFADSLISYNEAIKGANIDVEAIKNSAAAATALVEVSNALDKEGGVAKFFAGEVNLEGFGTGLSSLATGIADYAAAAATITEESIEKIKFSKGAVTAIQEVCNEITKSGGIADWFGKHDPGAFGTGISALALGITDMCNVAAKITQEDVDAIASLGKEDGIIAKIVDAVEQIGRVNDKNSEKLSIAIGWICGALEDINYASTAGYDYSSINSFETIVNKLKNLIDQEGAKALYTKYSSVASAVNDVTYISDTLAELNNTTYGGVTYLSKALENLQKADVQGAIDKFSGKSESLKTALDGIVSALQVSLTSEDAKNTIVNAMTELIDSGLAALTSETKLTEFTTAGTNLANSAIGGSNSEEVLTAANTAGQNLGQGYINGINAKLSAVRAAGVLLGVAAAGGINAGQRSHSPSKLGIQSGKWLGEGYVIGIDKMGRLVGQAGDGLGQTATNSLSNSISRISDMISSDIDSQPTIRPVLDLSDIESGASTIGSMLNLNSSVGVKANVGAISASMANRQNGDSELLSAIDKLAKSNSKSGDIYNFNGFSYSEGSDVADAIQTLVRAAKMEGRV